MFGFIERQEIEGQFAISTGQYLPKNMGTQGRYMDAAPAYNLAGIEIIGEEDKLFYKVKLPENWTVEPHSNSQYWSDLKDDNGKVRAEIFYKAAFYDRDAFINIPDFRGSHV